MACEMSREEDLEMMNVDFGGPDGPLNTQFVLAGCFDEKKLCPRFYGKKVDKLKVYYALTKDIHPEVKAQWGELNCHCSRIPFLRLSKTARNLNKVFLTCGSPASAETRCKYFQWIHTALFIDKRPLHKLKYATNLSRAEWMEQAEANVQRWKERHGYSNKQDVEMVENGQRDGWLNDEDVEMAENGLSLAEISDMKVKAEQKQTTQFAESAKQIAEAVKKQKEQRKFPWNSIALSSTFESSPEIQKELKKREQWKEVMSIAEHNFHSRVKGWLHLPPADANVAEYLAKQKSKGYSLTPADKKFLNACLESKHNEWKPPPGAEKYEKNEVAIAKAVYEDWSFGYLPEKVCSLMTYCRERKKEGLPLTPVQERFFAQLVNVCGPEETEKEKQEKEKRFLQECDANNAERRKHGMLPYSYETFRTYGSGIF